MKEVKIKLDTIEKMQKFVRLNTEHSFDCDVKRTDRHYIVDGRSFLGILSLDSADLVVSLNADELTENKFIAIMRQFE